MTFSHRKIYYFIRKEIILEVETKTFEFVVTKENGEKIINSEIQINNNPWKIVQNYTFTGEDIGREHTITARKGDNLFSKAIKITPKDYSGTIIPFSLQCHILLSKTYLRSEIITYMNECPILSV